LPLHTKALLQTTDRVGAMGIIEFLKGILNMGGKSFYRLQIVCEEYAYDEISSLLQVKPKELRVQNQLLKTGWVYEIIEGEDDEYYDFINKFLDILESKYSLLEKLEVLRSDITIWLIYEYNEQCNMEFDSKDLKRLGDNGIKLCISCYQGNDEDDDWTIKSIEE